MATKEKTVTCRNKLYGGLLGTAIVWMLRLVVGAVFVFSGFTKGIDPWGSIYKFDEYLRAFGFYDYRGLLTFMAFSVSAVEFVLGVFLLFGIYRRFTPWAMTAMMAVMLPLTCYIAVTDNVADCGCFGDAVTLSNWGTFWKNVALTVGLVYLIMFNSRVKNIYGFAVQWIVAMLTFVYILLVAWLGYSFQPLVDFRPFPVGTVISGEDVEAADEYAFIYEKNGVKQEFSLDSLPDDTWTFVDRMPLSRQTSDTVAVDVALHRPIAVFDTTYVAVDDVILDRGEQLLLLFPSLSDVVIPFTYRINEICDFCRKHDIDVVGLTSDGKAEIDEWNDLSMADYPMYVMDDSELKMLARGNPAAVMLRDGTVAWKRTMQSMNVDYIDEAENIDEVAGDVELRHVLYFITLLYLSAMLLVLVVNRTHLVVKFSLRRVRKSRKKAVNLQSENNNE